MNQRRKLTKDERMVVYKKNKRTLRLLWVCIGVQGYAG